MNDETEMRLAAVQQEMTPAAEHEIIRRAAAGDEDAFRMLMDRYRAHALAIALRITRSREDAEDVVQQAFVRAWYALDRFRFDSAFRTWLHSIVARRALDRASQIKLLRSREDELDDVHPLDLEPHRDVILIRRLEQLLKRLSPAQRAVVTLHYWEDATVSEISSALGIPENTVKTHLSRARAALREAWLSMERSQ